VECCLATERVRERVGVSNDEDSAHDIAPVPYGLR
jgi:hypothetical protein